MTLIAYAFPTLRTSKDLIRKMSKKPEFRTSFDSQHLKGPQTLLKAPLLHFYHIFSLL